MVDCHKSKHISKFVLLLFLSSCCMFASADTALPDGFELPQGVDMVSVKKYKRFGKDFYSVTYRDSKTGKFEIIAVDGSGRVISQDEPLIKKRDTVLTEELERLLNNEPDDSEKLFKVHVYFQKEESVSTDIEGFSTSTSVRDGVATTSKYGEVLDSDSESQELIERRAKQKLWQDKLHERNRKTIKEIVKLSEISMSPEIEYSIERGASSFKVSLNKKDILKVAQKASKYVFAIGLAPKFHSSSIGGAMQDAKVDPWAINYSGRKGENIGIFITEEYACPAAGYTSNYLNVASTGSTTHPKHMVSIVRAVSPLSYIYCDGPNVNLPPAASYGGIAGNPPIKIVNISAGGGYPFDYSMWDAELDDESYDKNVPIVNAAGNSGGFYETVASGGKALNVLTVGNYDHRTHVMRSTSSWLEGNIPAEKPEVSAPGTNIMAGGINATGTSQSTAFVTGFGADLLSAYSWLRDRPAYLKAYIMASATVPIAGGYDKVGLGGLDFFDAYFDAENTEWNGTNNSFSYFDSIDSDPNSGYIEREVYLSSSIPSVQVVYSWLTRGAYTYAHRNDSFPLGMDFDIFVYDPNGGLVGSSTHTFNSWEHVEFDPQLSGTYTVKIAQTANRDSQLRLIAGLSISW